MNTVNLVGRLTKDPELKYVGEYAKATFTVAVQRRFDKDKADFVSCVAWRKQAENLANYQKKGNLIGVEGRLETGSYEKDGKRVYTTDVVADVIHFLDSKKDSQTQPQQQQAPSFEIDDSDLPF